MNFLELTEKFEAVINENFEVLEFHHLPYAFGSGTKSYRIKGRNIKMLFDGKDHFEEIMISPPPERYPSRSWNPAFTGSSNDLLNKGIKALKQAM